MFSSFRKNAHTAWFDAQTKTIKQRCITKQTASHESTVHWIDWAFVSYKNFNISEENVVQMIHKSARTVMCHLKLISSISFTKRSL